MALLIMMNEWLGPGNKMVAADRINCEAKESLVSFYAESDLQAALNRILTYQRAYNERYRLAVNFTLLSVSEVEALPDQLLDDLRVCKVVSLHQKAGDF